MVDQRNDLLPTKEKIKLLAGSGSQLDEGRLASLAKLYAQDSDLDNAIVSISKAIKLAPLNAAYHDQLARYASLAGKNLLARTESAIADDLGFSDLNHQILELQLALDDGDTTKFLRMMGSMVNDVTPVPMLNYLYGVSYLMGKDTLEAIHRFKECIQKEPDMDKASLALSRIYAGEDSIELALNEVNRMLSRKPKLLNFILLKAELMEQMDATEEAINLYMQHWTLSHRAESLVKVKQIYWNRNEYDSVLKYSRIEAAIVSREKDGLLSEARALDKLRQYQASLKIYTKLYELDTLDSKVGKERTMLERKIAYLQRKKEEEKKLADSLIKTLPALKF